MICVLDTLSTTSSDQLPSPPAASRCVQQQLTRGHILILQYFNATCVIVLLLQSLQCQAIGQHILLTLQLPLVAVRTTIAVKYQTDDKYQLHNQKMSHQLAALPTVCADFQCTNEPLPQPTITTLGTTFGIVVGAAV